MPTVFWIGISVAALCIVVGFIAGTKARNTSTLTGLATGAYLGVMFAFPLLAIGLATS